MKIAYLYQYFKKPSDSGSTRAYEMAKRLAARGHEVHVVSTIREGPAFKGWRTENLAGFTAHQIYVPYENEMGFYRRLYSFLQFAWKAGVKARRLRCRIVFATSTPLTISIPARMATVWRDVPIVFEVRDLWPEVPIAIGALRSRASQWLAFALQRFAYRNSNHIVALSTDMKEGIIRRGVPSGLVSVIPNSSDLDLFDVEESKGDEFRREHRWLGDRPLALYAGTLGRVNDVRYIVRLAQEALGRLPDLRFVIVGRGAERDLVAQAAREAGVLNRNFYMLEPVPKSALPPIYSAAAVVFSTVAPVPELAANSANKVFDAFAAGRPVAINHEGWQAELLRSSGAGVVLPSHDVSAAVGTLARLVRDPAAAGEAGRAARRLAKERFARDLHGAELASVLEGAVVRIRKPNDQ